MIILHSEQIIHLKMNVCLETHIDKGIKKVLQSNINLIATLF